MSVVYTSHYMEEVELLCNRVAIIDQGKIVAGDTIKNLVAMLGGGVIHIGLSEVNETLVAEIAALPGVKTAVQNPPVAEKDQEAVEAKSRVIKVECEKSEQALINIITYLAGKEQTITSLEILEPNLESVFLHLTGKKLRE
jgi:ABC-2 type transport system ATP-binding protein